MTETYAEAYGAYDIARRKLRKKWHDALRELFQYLTEKFSVVAQLEKLTSNELILCVRGLPRPEHDDISPAILRQVVYPYLQQFSDKHMWNGSLRGYWQIRSEDPNIIDWFLHVHIPAAEDYLVFHQRYNKELPVPLAEILNNMETRIWCL